MAIALSQGLTLGAGARIGWNIFYLPPFPVVPEAAGVPQLFVPGQGFDQALEVTSSTVSLVMVSSLPQSLQTFFPHLQEVFQYSIVIQNMGAQTVTYSLNFAEV
jgi:hypothetical protein